MRSNMILVVGLLIGLICLGISGCISLFYIAGWQSGVEVGIDWFLRFGCEGLIAFCVPVCAALLCQLIFAETGYWSNSSRRLLFSVSIGVFIGLLIAAWFASHGQTELRSFYGGQFRHLSWGEHVYEPIGKKARTLLSQAEVISMLKAFLALATQRAFLFGSITPLVVEILRRAWMHIQLARLRA